jgi:hypothetical protein
MTCRDRGWDALRNRDLLTTAEAELCVHSHPRIHVRDGRHRDMLRLGQHIGLENALCGVAPGQLVGRGANRTTSM